MYICVICVLLTCQPQIPLESGKNRAIRPSFATYFAQTNAEPTSFPILAIFWLINRASNPKRSKAHSRSKSPNYSCWPPIIIKSGMMMARKTQLESTNPLSTS